MRTAVAGFTGTALEYYDFFIYGTAAALVFGKLFFPSYSPLAGTLASFGTFAVGFIARPVGSIIFGHLGDRVGRRATLIYALSLMGAATVLIGCLPTYEQVGWAAPLLLVFLRIIQGISIGGEWGGAALMLVEHAPPHRRGLYGSVVYMGAPGGLLLATLAVSISDNVAGDAFLSWGWRVPFLFSGVLFVISLFIRLGLEETPVFTALEKEQQTQRAPFRKLFATQWRDILLAGGVVFPGAVLFYIVSTYAIAYGTGDAVGMSRNDLLDALLAASVVYFVAIPIFGYLSDVVSRKAVLVFGGVMAIPGSFLLFVAVNTGSALATFGGMVFTLAVVHAALVAPQAALFSSRFDPRVRFSGVAFSQAFAASIAGGTAPILATLFYAWTGSSWLICLWLSLGAIVGIFSTVALCNRQPVTDFVDYPTKDSDSPDEVAAR
ncbi:MFS transporter [Rhodococcus opacus]|uniref:MFS transporter n=1 Tax=Rhodococcus opacus TaxID=37919 RepID=UPI0018C8BE2D|nr:MFS transporter [Rhodococcus opacus]